MNLYQKFLKKIAHFQVENPYLSIMLIGFLSLMIWGGIAEVKTVASLEQMMPKDIEEIKAFNVLRDNYLGQDMIAVVLEIDRNANSGIIDITDKAVYEYSKYVKEQLLLEPDVLEVYAFSDIIDMAGYSEQIDDEEVQGDYQSILETVSGSLGDYVNNDKTISLILATTDISADDPRMNLLSAQIKDLIDKAGHPPGVKIQLTGTPVIQQKLGELIAKDRNDTKAISTFLVFIITMIIFGTFTSALVPIAVVTISVNWLYGTMGYSNLPISTLAGGVAAMVIGIGIDFAIHIMNKFKYERKKGMGIKKAIEQAVVETGTALTATSITTISAFLAFLVGRMPEMGRFGMLMAIGISYSLIFSLFGLPALLIIEEKLIYYLRTKLKFGIEGELKLKTKKEAC